MGGEAGVVSMIPGISNIPSIGSKPTCRGGKAIVMNSVVPNISPSKKPFEISRSRKLDFCRFFFAAKNKPE